MSYLNFLAEDRRLVVYRTSLLRISGSITASLLLQQVLYQWEKNKHKPFFAFNDACEHPFYKAGHSFQEQLGFTKNELIGARNRIAVKVNAKTRDEVLAYSPIVYWTGRDRVTWYEVNDELMEKALRMLYDTPEHLPEGRTNLTDLVLDYVIPDFGNTENQNYQNLESGDTKKIRKADLLTIEESKDDLLSDEVDSSSGSSPDTDDEAASEPQDISDAQKHWELALDDLMLQMPPAVFRKNFQSSSVVSVSTAPDGRPIYTIALANPSAVALVKNRMADTVRRTLTGVAERPIGVRFDLINQRPATTKPEATEDGASKRVTLSNEQPSQPPPDDSAAGFGQTVY